MKISIDVARATIWQRGTFGDRLPIIVHPAHPDRPLRADKVVIGWHWSAEDGWHALDITFHGTPATGSPDGPTIIAFGMMHQAMPADVAAIVTSLKPSAPPEGAVTTP